MSAITSIIDWDTCKLQYEVLGESLERIALLHNFPVQSIRNVANAEEWKPIKPSSHAYKSYLAGILNQHKAKLSLAMLYRELEMFPHVAEVEVLLMEKIKLAVTYLDPSDTKTPSSLRSLSSALNSITEHQTILKSQLNDLFSNEDTPEVKVQMEFGNIEAPEDE